MEESDESLDSMEVSRWLGAWSRADGRGLRSGGGRRGFRELQFHRRPDPTGPDETLTLRAEIVDGRAVIVATSDPAAAGRSDARPRRLISVPLGVSDSKHSAPHRDPTAACEGCGAVGTIGRAARVGEGGAVVEEHRFCASCWPEHSARYRARWEEEDRLESDAFMRSRAAVPMRTLSSILHAATWHMALETVRDIERSMRRLSPPAAEDLKVFADQLRAGASEMEGEMPFEITMFIHKYGTPSSPR